MSSITRSINASESLNLKRPLRLGAISFINTLPLYHGFCGDTDHDVHIQHEVPSELNRLMLAGELDISPVSSAFYLQHKSRFTLLPALSVSSFGAVESVVFVSSTPWGPALKELSHIAVPSSSATSIALLRWLLWKATGKDLGNRFVSYPATQVDQALETYGNALIIGDEALVRVNQTRNTTLHYIDLASLWTKTYFPEVPFVFAVWIAQTHWYESHQDKAHRVINLLNQTRINNLATSASREGIIQKAQQHRNLPSDCLERYFTQCLNFEFGPDHQKALELFEEALTQLPLLEEDSSLLIRRE
jgi:chorismate dehydratase